MVLRLCHRERKRLGTSFDKRLGVERSDLFELVGSSGLLGGANEIEGPVGKLLQVYQLGYIMDAGAHTTPDDLLEHA